MKSENNLEELDMGFKEWDKVFLSDIMDIIGGGTPKTTVEGYWNGHINWISVKDFNGGRKYITNTEKTITELGLNKSSTKLLQKKDIIISARGTVGALGMISKPMAFNQSCYGLRAKSHINSDFLFYLLKNSILVLQNNTHGSVFNTITRTTFDTIEVKVPPLNEQKAIADILSSLDDKIELNNQMNETLEEMAQALFKRWFVDFEFPNEEGKPYKSSGGEMVESELGMIPKGWGIAFFRDYMVDILGGDWGKEEATGNYNKAVYCLRGADIPEIRAGRKGKMPRRYILEKNYLKKKLTNGDLVVEISGGSPTQSTGRITYISKALLEKYDLDIVSTNFCRAITLKDIYMTEFYYYYWNYLYNNDVFFQYENGTTGIKNLSINSFLDKFSIVQPPKELLKVFHDKINIILLFVQTNGEENEKLAHVRDSLLPKLMSGEIRVSDLKS